MEGEGNTVGGDTLGGGTLGAGTLGGATVGEGDGACVCGGAWTEGGACDGGLGTGGVKGGTSGGIRSGVVLSISANFCRASKVESPASKEGHIVDGGCFKMVTRSVAAWEMKSMRLTLGKGILCGRNTAVSITRSHLVLGK